MINTGGEKVSPVEVENVASGLRAGSGMRLRWRGRSEGDPW